MRLIALLFALFVAPVLVSGAAQLRDAGWSASGPEGGEVFALVASPAHARTVYAATAGGVFKSTTGGLSWTRASRGLASGWFGARALGLDPKSPRTLYAAAGDGVWKSVDGAGSWVRVKRFRYAPGQLAVAPSSTGTVYAVELGGWNPSKLWRSANGGRSWVLTDAKLPSTDSVAVDPASARRVYVGGRNGLFRSEDGGRTWRRTLTDSIASITADPASLGPVYAGGWSGSIYMSTDGGAHWSQISTLRGGRVTSLAFERETHVLWAGTSRVYRSTDAGRTWSSPGPGLGKAITSIAAGPHTLAASERGIWRDVDGAWKPANAGLVATQISAVAADPADPKLAYANIGRTILATTDGASSWHVVGEFPVDGAEASDLAIDPRRPATIYAAVLVYPGPSAGLVLKSTDRAATWKIVKRGIRPVALAVDPSRPQVVYAASIREGVYRSTDGGATWRRPSRGEPVHVSALAIDPLRPGTLYAGTYTYDGQEAGSLYRTTDSAATWQKLDGLPPSGIWAIAVDYHRPGVVYVATTRGIFKSEDGGAGWRPVSLGLPAADPKGLHAVMYLVSDPKRADVLYAGHSEEGVFVTTNGGNRWRAANAGLPSRTITGLAVGARGARLFAGTLSNGVGVASLPLDLPAPPRNGG